MLPPAPVPQKAGSPRAAVSIAGGTEAPGREKSRFRLSDTHTLKGTSLFPKRPLAAKTPVHTAPSFLIFSYKLSLLFLLSSPLLQKQNNKLFPVSWKQLQVLTSDTCKLDSHFHPQQRPPNSSHKTLLSLRGILVPAVKLINFFPPHERIFPGLFLATPNPDIITPRSFLRGGLCCGPVAPRVPRGRPGGHRAPLEDTEPQR